MALAKLIVLAEIKGIALPFVPLVEAMFNPSQLTFIHTTNWHATPTVASDATTSDWTHGLPANLSLDLLFDTYESELDVRLYTGRVAALIAVRPDLGRPPRCQLVWGRFGIFFQGVLQSLNQNFTLFLADGTPTRATLGCTFQEWREDDERAAVEEQPLAQGTRTLTPQRGESLSSIAAREYNDPSQWRAIADANGIDNPLKLPAGTPLAVPPLRPRRAPRR